MMDFVMSHYAQVLGLVVVAFALCRLLADIKYIIRDPRFWVKEIKFRIDILRRSRRGLSIPRNVTNNWYFSEVCYVLAIILLVQQGILALALMNVMEWYDTLEKIVEFHESNPDVARPNISQDMVDDVFAPKDYMYYSGIVFALGAVFMMTLDRKIKEWKEGQAPVLSVLGSVLLLFTMVDYMISIFYYLMTTCPAGELLLRKTLLGK